MENKMLSFLTFIMICCLFASLVVDKASAVLAWVKGAFVWVKAKFVKAPAPPAV